MYIVFPSLPLLDVDPHSNHVWSFGMDDCCGLLEWLNDGSRPNIHCMPCSRPNFNLGNIRLWGFVCIGVSGLVTTVRVTNRMD